MTDNVSDDLVERIDALLAREGNDRGYEAFVLMRKHWPVLKSLRNKLAAAEADKYALNCSYDAAQERLKVTFERAISAESRLATATKVLEKIEANDREEFTNSLGPDARIAREALHAIKPDGEAKTIDLAPHRTPAPLEGVVEAQEKNR